MLTKVVAKVRNRNHVCFKCGKTLKSESVFGLLYKGKLAYGGDSCIKSECGFLPKHFHEFSLVPYYFGSDRENIHGYFKFLEQNDIRSASTDAERDSIASEYFVLRMFLLEEYKLVRFEEAEFMIRVWSKGETKKLMGRVFRMMAGAQEKYPKLSLANLRAVYAMDYWLEKAISLLDEGDSGFLTGMLVQLHRNLMLREKHIAGINSWFEKIDGINIYFDENPFNHTGTIEEVEEHVAG